MAIKNTAHSIVVSKEECQDTIELVMCKKVVINTEEGTVELFQKNIQIAGRSYPPGQYPSPCKFSGMRNVEVFSRGLFTIVRVFSAQDRFVPLYEVS